MIYTRRLFHAFLATCALTVALPAPSHAQMNDNRAAMERMDRMERDMMMLQRQISRSGRSTGTVNDGAAVAAPGGAQAEVRLSAMEEELRSLRGKLEENDFQLKRLNETVEKMQKETDFRFNELSGQPPAPAAAPATEKAPEEKTPSAAPAVPTSGGTGELSIPKQVTTAEGEQVFEQPRDHYNHAFRLLNQTRYDDAAKYFRSFTEKYPKDPLLGNAYYWLGETYYIRRDYTKAADQFRQGFEAMPSGPKAADNLLKLGMTLGNLKREKEACTVLTQLIARFKNSSTAVIQKAQAERTRLACQ